MNRPQITRRALLQKSIAGMFAFKVCRTVLGEEASSTKDSIKIAEVRMFHVKHQGPRAIGPSTAFYQTRESILVPNQAYSVRRTVLGEVESLRTFGRLRVFKGSGNKPWFSGTELFE